MRDHAIDLLAKLIGWSLLLATFGPLLVLVVRGVVTGDAEYRGD
jgi:hypothetical protein